MNKVMNRDCNCLLKLVPVKKCDFYFVPSGKIHAIGNGIVILEIQQSSDITYRVYDYERKDATGNKRELHLEQAIEVTKFPDSVQKRRKEKSVNGSLEVTKFIEGQYFTVYHWNLAGHIKTPLANRKDRKSVV